MLHFIEREVKIFMDSINRPISGLEVKSVEPPKAYESLMVTEIEFKDELSNNFFMDKIYNDPQVSTPQNVVNEIIMSIKSFIKRQSS